MKNGGFKLPSPEQISKALSSSTSSKELHKIHSLIVVFGLAQSPSFSGNLISKYAKFRNPNSSLSVFRGIWPTTNVYLWNSVIRAATHNKLFSQALDLYCRMKKGMILPDMYTFPSVINACAGISDIQTGKIVHSDVVKLGFVSDLYTGNALIDMYSRFCDLECARKVFDKMPQRDLVSWNSLVSGYSSNGYWLDGLELFNELRMTSLRPDLFTISSVLPACANLVAVNEGQMVHGLVEKIGYVDDTLVMNGLLSLYIKFDRLADCEKIFSEVKVRDMVTWNTMICGYSNSGCYEKSIKLCMQMLPEFRPDMLTLTSVFNACGHMKDINSGKYVHDYMTKNGYECDTMASNILINMYAKCGYLSAARDIFDQMKITDSVSFNSMISAYVQNGYFEEAKKVFKMMKMDSSPDFVTYVTLLSMSSKLINLDCAEELHCEIIKLGFDSALIVCNSLVDTYAKCGKVQISLKMFQDMKSRDIITWNTVIAACVHCDEPDLGFNTINQMRIEGFMPDVATILGTLPLCSLLAAKRQGKEMHGYIFKLGFDSNVPIGNALIEMYSKCGNLKLAVFVFDHMKNRDVVTWTTLISAYGMYGEGKRALISYENMKKSGIVPDHIAFVAIIYACSHSGLVEEGKACFHQMKNECNVEPKIEHFACMVDLLARSGHLTEAEEFISSMPSNLKPDASIWGSLLSACRTSKNLEIINRVSKRIIKSNSNDTGYQILVSNAYASLGEWEQVRTVRNSLRNRGLKKDPGLSWLEIKKRVHVFQTGDRSFEQYEQVNELIKSICGLMEKDGVVVDLGFALHNVEESEKKDLLCGHSERLAIGFGLLNTDPGTSLQVMKNLRVCGDCHSFTKYVSKISKRELLVRDANRFHLFKDGICSCGDHW